MGVLSEAFGGTLHQRAEADRVSPHDFFLLKPHTLTDRLSLPRCIEEQNNSKSIPLMEA